eukprot:snap_masked-scaffold_23-processed-gene-5.7-mRNA-1 protein AED:1.00 eAED:1.00 QI:0/0/0/0/1/1/4/0/60
MGATVAYIYLDVLDRDEHSMLEITFSLGISRKPLCVVLNMNYVPHELNNNDYNCINFSLL